MRSKAREALHAVKQAIRQPYAWPGGYPLYVVMADGESLSIKAARENWGLICNGQIKGCADDWCVEGVEVNWEDDTLTCCQSGESIESAYL